MIKILLWYKLNFNTCLSKKVLPVLQIPSDVHHTEFATQANYAEPAAQAESCP